MVLINPILAQEGINPGSPPSTAVDTSVGRGLQQFGASVEDLNTVLQAHQNAINSFATDQSFKRFQSDNALSFSKQQENIDPSGQGLTKNVVQDFDQRSKQFLSTVPDSLKPQYEQLVATAKEQWLNKASAAEIDQRNDWYRQGIKTTSDGLQNQVFDDPSTYQGALDEGNRTIDASGLPPVEKDKLKKAWKETLAVTLGQREARDALNDPQSAIGAAARLGVQGAATSKIAQASGMMGVNPSVALGIAKIESDFNPNAKNPRSSATGTFQITSGAAKDLGIDPTDENQNILGGVRLIKQNTDALRATTGQEPAPGDVYLAHFLGLGAAEKIVGADPNAPISNYVADGAIAANRSILEGKTVGQVRQWAQQKMASAMGGSSSGSTDVPTNPAYADLPLSKRLEIYDNIQSSAAKGLSALQAQQKAAYDNQMGSLKLGIETGQVNSPQTITGASWLKDADKATLLHQLNAQLKTNGAISAHIAAVSAGGDAAKINPFDSKERDLDNKAYNQAIKTVPEENVQSVSESWVKTTGNVPDQVVANIRQDLSSQNVANVSRGMAEASKLYQIAPGAFDAVPNGDDLKKAALAYNTYTYDRGLSDQEAGTRWMQAHSPEAIQQREQLKKPAADFVKTLSITDVTSALNHGFPVLGRPNAGLTPEQQAAVMSDYTKIANEDFIKAGGDPDLAKKLALADMSKLYGVSDVSGSKTIMKFPPENYYPKIDGSWNYIREDALAGAKSLHPGAQNVMLRPTKETADDIRTNQRPRYQLWYQRPDGTWDQDPNQLFRVDPQKISDMLGQERQTRLDQAQALHKAAMAYENRPPQTVDTTSQATMSNSALTNAVDAWAPVKGMPQPAPAPVKPRPAAEMDNSGAKAVNDAMTGFMQGWGSTPYQAEKKLQQSGAAF